MNDSSTKRLAIAIPVRYTYTRLPGKPMADKLASPWCGMSMSGHSTMTLPEHPSGTYCLAEVMTQVDTLRHPIAVEKATNPNTV